MKKKVNVIFLIDSAFPFYTGGRETWLYNVSNRISKVFNVYIVSFDAGKAIDNRNGRMLGINENVCVLHSFTIRKYRWARVVLRSYLDLITQFLDNFFMGKTLGKLIKDNKDGLNVVISMDTLFTAKLGEKAKKLYKNVIFINSVRAPHAEIRGDRFPALKKWLIKREKHTLQCADRVWSNGYDTKKRITNDYKIESVIIKNGIDCSRKAEEKIPRELLTENMDFHILSIGTLLDIKGYKELIKAIFIVKTRYKLKVGLTIFGKGNKKPYEDLARQLGVFDQVIFAGFQSKTIEYASKFDLIACLSGGGGMSMACLESLFSGVPVVAWDSDIYRQMIDNGHTGILVEEKNVDKLAEAIIWVVNNQEECLNMGKNARQVVKKYDWNNIASAVQDEIEMLSREYMNR